jgi:hypothetical protein
MFFTVYCTHHGAGLSQLSLLATLAGGIGYAQRAALAVSIVRLQSIFGWDKILQGQILSSFFLGYMVCQIPGTQLRTAATAHTAVPCEGTKTHTHHTARYLQRSTPDYMNRSHQRANARANPAQWRARTDGCVPQADC